MPDILVDNILDSEIPMFQKNDANGNPYLRTTFVEESTGKLFNAVVFFPPKNGDKLVGPGKLIIRQVVND